MNLFRIFLAFYFLALSVMPCSDIYSNMTSDNSDSIEISHSEAGDKQDVCSPLCFCNCCQISLMIFDFKAYAELNPILVFYSKRILFHKNTFAYQVYYPIWQPPKI